MEPRSDRESERRKRADQRSFVTVECIVALAMVVVALVVTGAAHAPVFGGVLLLFAGMTFGHALAITLGFAHPPRERKDAGRGSRRR